MGILSRFKDIMSSNINAMLDKMEDPSKMIDQYLRDLNDALGQVKSETAGVMAEAQRAKRAVEECQDEIQKLADYAGRAVAAGNDDDARRFLTQKAEYTAKLQNLQEAYSLADANAQKMRQMHDKLVQQIDELHNRKDAIKAKVSVAKTQERINSITEKMGNTQNHISAFDRMEEKANRLLDEANARAELNAESDSIEDLKSKYSAAASADIEAELAALKAQAGK